MILMMMLMKLPQQEGMPEQQLLHAGPLGGFAQHLPQGCSWQHTAVNCTARLPVAKWA